jgi:hypothetical protein
MAPVATVAVQVPLSTTPPDVEPAPLEAPLLVAPFDPLVVPPVLVPDPDPLPPGELLEPPLVEPFGPLPDEPPLVAPYPEDPPPSSPGDPLPSLWLEVEPHADATATKTAVPSQWNRLRSGTSME